MDLKDACFCTLLEEETQKFFAFEWESPTLLDRAIPGI